MDFALTEQQHMIADAARQVLDDSGGAAGVERALKSEQGYDAQLWSQLREELCWSALNVPEDCGGMGLGAVEVALVLEQAGRTATVSPYLANVIASTVLQSVSGDRVRNLLSAIASGASWFGVTMPSSPAGWVTGTSGVRALDADAPGGVLFSVSNKQQATQCRLLSSDAATDLFRRIDSIDPTHRMFEARNASALAGDSVLLGEISPTDLDHVSAVARLYLAAELLGDAQACLDLTLAHVAERKQFGRTLSSFQAIKHRCAEMMVRIETLRSQVYGAAASVSSASTQELSMECMAARSLSIDTAFWCAQEAIQLHGGVGFTWEYQPHWHFKRAQATRDWLGDVESLRESIAQQLLAVA